MGLYLTSAEASLNMIISSKVLLELCEKIFAQQRMADLATIHEYLQARLTLLRNLPV